MGNEISVLDMIETYTSEHDISELDMFKSAKPVESDNTNVVEPVKEMTNQPISSTNNTTTEAGGWVPDAELLEDMPELNQQGSGGIIFDKEDWKESIDDSPVNQLEDEAETHGREALTSTEFAINNIEKAKRELGITHLNIPTIYNPKIMDYAADRDPKVHQDQLIDFMKSIIDMFPDAVAYDNIKNEVPVKPYRADDPVDSAPTAQEESEEKPSGAEPDDQVTILIDKSNVSQVAFDTAEIDKIKKSRKVEINIIERPDVKYSIIENDTNDVDTILSTYTRKVNDRTGTLPASRYNCTFVGLTYGEFLDLSYSNRANSIEGERLKWQLAYNHIKNPSIQFKSFDDFLTHTSFIDLNYILWNILCVTCMDKEIISIDCKYQGCNSTYDWVYNPKDLLDLTSISQEVLDEVAKTAECKTEKDVQDNYNKSLVMSEQLLELHSSGFVVCFGHVSAKEYLTSRLGLIEELKDDKDNGTDVSAMTVMESLLTGIVKYILIPDKQSNGYHKITDPEGIVKVIHKLDVVDYQTIYHLYDKLIGTYSFTFALRDIVCPKCNHRTSLEISDMADLLFFLSKSLDAEITFVNY